MTTYHTSIGLVLILCLIVFSLIFVFWKPNEAFASLASSKSFGRQEVKDGIYDWIDLQTGLDTKGASFIDIDSINYFSDGRFLNSTLWLRSLDALSINNGMPTSQSIYYGMLIDADSNNNTGFQGIDYQVEVKWSNKTNTWTRTTNEFSSGGHTRNISALESNYTGFYERGKNYVMLHADLSSMLFPVKYKVFFYAYAQEKQDSLWVMDPVRWIFIPPPEFTLLISPPGSTNLRTAEHKTLELIVNSSTDLKPQVQFYTSSLPDDLDIDFKYDQTIVPSYGRAATPMTISTSEDAIPRPNTIYVLANLSFPVEYFDSPIRKNNAGQPVSKIRIESENVTTQTSFLVNIECGFWQCPVEVVSDLWNKIGDFTQFAYLVAGAIMAWLITRYRSWIQKKKESKLSQLNQ